jgi:pimeloyl-ACP methyl ester carboxylesterase
MPHLKVAGKLDPAAVPPHPLAEGGAPICQNCGGPLATAWRAGGQLCSQCGLNDELFRPETRWMDGGGLANRRSSTGEKTPGENSAPPHSARLAMLRFGLKALAAVAPAAAEEQGARMFFTPRRTPRWRAPAISKIAATSLRFSIGGQEMACWCWGRGPTVILIHGWEGYAAQLTHFVAPLVDAGFRVVTFDMPAHGGSTGQQISVFDMSRAIRAVAEVFSPTRAVIAHSLGGAASILALSEGLKVDRVVLLAPAAEPRHFAKVLARMLGFSKTRTDGMLKRIENRLGMRFEDASTLRMVPKMNVPVLVMHDPHDAEVPFEHGKSIAQAWPGARLEQLNEMGHRRMLRNPNTISAVTAFIAARDTKSGTSTSWWA